MRMFEKTHPWLTFSLDLRQANPRLWMALGEAQSKCEHIAGVPLRPDTAKELHGLYLAKGVAATTAIEGNTLSEEDVRKHLEGKLLLPPSKAYLGQEVDNIITACNDILARLVAGPSVDLTPDQIKSYNRQILNKLMLEPGIVPGEITTRPVGVLRYRGAPPEDDDYLLDKLCAWLNGPDFHPATGLEIVYGILKAVMAHLYLAWIHPFGDGNGRTARLMEFHILIAVGVPSDAAHLLSNHYNQTRNEYYRQLQQASESGGNVLPFIEYAVAGFVDGLQGQLKVIRDQQWDVTWRNYVHETFRGKTSRAAERQRHVVLDMSSQAGPIPLSKVQELSPRTAAAYAGKTQKTVVRDINALCKMALLERTPEGIRAKREVILAFLPTRCGARQPAGPALEKK